MQAQYSNSGLTYEEELERQNDGLISIIVAWVVESIPTGYSFVSREGARDLKVRKLVPNVPDPHSYHDYAFRNR